MGLVIAGSPSLSLDVCVMYSARKRAEELEETLEEVDVLKERALGCRPSLVGPVADVCEAWGQCGSAVG